MKRILPIVVLAALAGPASAHVSSVTYAELAVDGPRVSYQLKLSARDLYEALHLEKDRIATQEEVTAGTAALEAYVLAKVKVTRRGTACTATPQGVGSEDAGDGFYAVVSIDYACPRPVDVLELRYDLFFDVDKRHESRTHFTWRATGEAVPRSQEIWLKDAARDLRWDRSAVVDAVHTPGTVELAARGQLGVLASPVELLALIALIAAFALGTATRYRGALWVVAGFALGHLAGLAAARAGWITLSPRLTEVALAATVIYLALENLVTGAPPLRWAVAVGFGAVHGIGFAHRVAAGGTALVAAAAVLAQLVVAFAALALLGWVARGAGPNRRTIHWASGALGLGGALLLVLGLSS